MGRVIDALKALFTNYPVPPFQGKEEVAPRYIQGADHIIQQQFEAHHKACSGRIAVFDFKNWVGFQCDYCSTAWSLPKPGYLER